MVRPTQTSCQQKPANLLSVYIDHFVGSDRKRLNHRNVSNNFFLYYLSFFPAFWTKPFPFSYFFDMYAFKIEPDNFARVIFPH